MIRTQILLAPLFACLLASAAAAQPAPAPAPGTPAFTHEASGNAVPDAATDPSATRKLQARLNTDQDLRQVDGEVDHAGVAELDGTVLQPGHRAQADEIAAKTPGVTTVVNNVDVDGSVGSHLRAAYRDATGKLVAIASRAPLLLVSFAIVLLAFWFGGVLSRHLRLLRLRTDNPYMDGLVRRTVRIVVGLIGFVLALKLLDLTALVGAVLGSAGVVGLALGFAFKDIAENYIAGILLSVRRPFAPGQQIRIDSFEGKVVALTSRATTLMTPDGNQLQLPNAVVFKSVLLNFNENPKRRFDFIVTVDPASSIRQSQTVALDALSRLDGVLQDPAPSWSVVEYAPGGIQLQFFGWVDQRESDLGKVRSESIRLVKAAFAQAGIRQPRTVYHVVASRGSEPEQAGSATAEPAHAAGADTSVNTDIDEQLAQAQRAGADRNLLEPAKDTP